MKHTVEGILEGISALVLLLMVEFVAVGFVYLLADSNGFYPPPPVLALAGIAGLFVWFCILFTLAHRRQLTGRDGTTWRPLR